jgi:hypothetical protein
MRPPNGFGSHGSMLGRATSTNNIENNNEGSETLRMRKKDLNEVSMKLQ